MVEVIAYDGIPIKNTKDIVEDKPIQTIQQPIKKKQQDIKHIIKDERPWARQRKLQAGDIQGQQEIYELALTFTDRLEQSLFILLYLCGCRVSEVLPCDYLTKNIYLKKLVKDEVTGVSKLVVVRNDKGSPMVERTERVEHVYSGIRRKDLIFETLKGKNVLTVSLENRKNKTRKRKRLAVPIEHERKFVDLLMRYVNTLSDKQPLFPNLTVLKAEKIIKKVDMNCHWLRDVRLTHLVLIYDFDGFRLQKYAGWSSISPANRYVQLSVSDFVDKY